DNSGARKLMCILPVGGDAGLKAGLGDVITASVKEATPESQVKQGTVVKAVIVRMRKERRRRDGTYIRFDDNAAVLINDAGEPVAIMKRHTRPNPTKNIKGGIVEKEAAIHVSNVMVVCGSCNKHTRIGHAVLPDGTKTRNCRHCNASLDK